MLLQVPSGLRSKYTFWESQAKSCLCATARPLLCLYDDSHRISYSRSPTALGSGFVYCAVRLSKTLTTYAVPTENLSASLSRPFACTLVIGTDVAHRINLSLYLALSVYPTFANQVRLCLCLSAYPIPIHHSPLPNIDKDGTIHYWHDPIWAAFDTEAGPQGLKVTSSLLLRPRSVTVQWNH